MQILGTKSTGCWHRRMRCMLLCALESPTSSNSTAGGALPKAYSQCSHPEASSALMQASATTGAAGIQPGAARYQTVAKTRCHQPCRTCASTTESARKGFQWLYRGGYSSALVKRVPMNFHSRQNGYMLQCQRWLSDYLRMKSNGASSQPYMNQDLRRFLVEVGTDPKEARYWLKQFQRLGSAPSKPFAVVQVHQDIFKQPQLLEALSSNLAFLHRNDMKMVVIHGADLPDDAKLSVEELQASRRQVTTETMVMVNFLESSGAQAHPMFSGSNVLKAELIEGSNLRGNVMTVNKEPLEWCMSSGHIPVVSSIGETSSSQLVNIDANQATAAIAKTLQPLKTLLLNNKGGLRDGKGKMIEQVHVPTDVETLTKQPWFTTEYQHQVDYVVSLLADLPPLSSVVITLANSILTELFTHHGSGTMFKNTERILKFTNLDGVDVDRLNSLLTRSFGRVLREDYMTDLPRRLHTIYLSEGYNAAAIITKEEVGDIPYLDKFSISQSTQGEGTSEMLWDRVRMDFPQLFWRSRNANKINPWYFKRCEGSWSNAQWTVFWYGISDPKVSYNLIDWTVKRKPSFISAHEKSFESHNMLDLI